MFDGDEGNLWALINYLAVAEGKYILNVDNCLISSQTNKPTVGLILDTVTGPYMSTYFNPILSLTEFNSLTQHITNRDSLGSLSRRAIKHGIHPESGKALFSALLPKDFNYQKGEVKIIDGILVHGSINSGVLGTAHRSILQELRKDIRYGPKRAIDFITDATYLYKAYLDEYGFSVGIDDCNPDSERARNLISAKVAEVRNRYELLMAEEVNSQVELEYKENQIIVLLQELSALGTKVVKESYSDDNAIRIMAKEIGGGAKGSAHNVTQISALLGEQFILGGLPEKQMTGGTRSLCTFESGETSMESQGCVLHSFSEGLTASEFFFHAQSSRQGLMDTAVKTSEIGSIHHKMVKAVEGIAVYYDGSVRDHLGNIVQFTYGGDGFDAAEMISVSTNKKQNLATFIDLKMTVAKINTSRGWVPRKTATSIRQKRRELLHSLYSKKITI